MSLADVIAEAVRDAVPPPEGAKGPDKKNYTEALSHKIAAAVTSELHSMGLEHVRCPANGRDKQFMGGYGTKGVDAYLSDEKHGLLLSSGVKGLVYDPRKNLKNRYRDMVMEALELHKRFPYAVCGHLFFIGKEESQLPSRKFGTVLGEAVALLSMINGRERPDEAPELYEVMGIVLLEPGDADSVDMAPSGVPTELQACGYCQSLMNMLNLRNPFYL